MYLIRNSIGEFVSRTGVLVNDLEHAEIFMTYEKAKERLDILKLISEDFYVDIYIDEYENTIDN